MKSNGKHSVLDINYCNNLSERHTSMTSRNKTNPLDNIVLFQNSINKTTTKTSLRIRKPQLLMDSSNSHKGKKSLKKFRKRYKQKNNSPMLDKENKQNIIANNYSKYIKEINSLSVI